MERRKLVGIKLDNTKARIGTEVSEFISDTNYFSITYMSMDSSLIELTTPEATYILKKHASQNYFHGELNGHKVQVTLRAISGEVRWWK